MPVIIENAKKNVFKGQWCLEWCLIIIISTWCNQLQCISWFKSIKDHKIQFDSKLFVSPYMCISVCMYACISVTHCVVHVCTYGRTNVTFHMYVDADPQWLLQDATFEKMGVLMAENGGRLLGMCDELSAFLTKIKLYSSRGLTDSHELAMFLELYNANPWTRTTSLFNVHCLKIWVTRLREFRRLLNTDVYALLPIDF